MRKLEMNDINFLCIDDQRDNTVDTLLKSISEKDGPKFERRTPTEVGEQLDLILQAANQHPGKFGVLLDLRLDMEADSAGNKVPYRGPTIAQELRTRMAEGTALASFPIILWSIATKFKNSYTGEDTSHDLFDAVYGKDLQIANEPRQVGQEMCALVNGYSCLSEAKINRFKSHEILKIPQKLSEGIYLEFTDELDSSLKSTATHYSARIIISQLLQHPGFLVDERLLAARLGVDIEASGHCWTKLRDEILVDTLYSGPFSAGWRRWWWSQVEDWWASQGDKRPSLRRVGASERVAFINSSQQLQLVAAKAIKAEYSDKFFTLCAATKKPLDPSDGFRVSISSKRNWQDAIFVSVDAALNRENKESWGRIHPSDRERFSSIKEGMKK